MKILLTNDDGINSPGIYALYKEMQKIGAVSIVAPETEQSAVGHAITISSSLKVKKVSRDGSFYGYSVNGTPADCVKLAVAVILKEAPDIVVSGINFGPNLGTNVIYSGTVSAATEGTILGIPSLAFSLATRTDPDYSYAACFARRLSLQVGERKLPEGVLLNVNIPALPLDKIKGIKITKQGKPCLKDAFEEKVDSRGDIHYSLKGEVAEVGKDEETDVHALGRHYISITPLHFDLTSYPDIDSVKKWNLSL